MRIILEWRIKRLKAKIERLAIQELTTPIEDCFPITLAKYKSELKLKDLQAEHDFWYGDGYEIHVVKRKGDGRR